MGGGTGVGGVLRAPVSCSSDPQRPRPTPPPPKPSQPQLEVVDGQVWANIWYTPCIARICPATGQVTGWMLLNGLRESLIQRGLPTNGRQIDVLNGGRVPPPFASRLSHRAAPRPLQLLDPLQAGPRLERRRPARNRRSPGPTTCPTPTADGRHRVRRGAAAAVCHGQELAARFRGHAPPAARHAQQPAAVAAVLPHVGRRHGAVSAAPRRAAPRRAGL
jgi:hypothetical protein